MITNQIIFIRHGEKNKDDNINLSDIGKIRAQELVKFFKNNINKNILVPNNASDPYVCSNETKS